VALALLLNQASRESLVQGRILEAFIGTSKGRIGNAQFFTGNGFWIIREGGLTKGVICERMLRRMWRAISGREDVNVFPVSLRRWEEWT